MPVTLAFDVYGTLIDTQGVVSCLGEIIGDKANEFSKSWRDKQLEYSFRRGLMQNYENFSVCTRQALDYVCQTHSAPLDQTQKNRLMDAYQSLPVFDDVVSSLTLLKNKNVHLYAFSNGSREAVDGLLHNAGVSNFFDGVVSCDDVKSFKPNPAVYAHFLRESGAVGANAWLVSSNSFDVIGAMSAGMRAAWVRRTPEVIFDPWGVEPSITLSTLKDLCQHLNFNEK